MKPSSRLIGVYPRIDRPRPQFVIYPSEATTSEFLFQKLLSAFPGLSRLAGDPVADDTKLHREWAKSIGPGRGKAAFVGSAEMRERRRGPGVRAIAEYRGISVEVHFDRERVRLWFPIGSAECVMSSLAHEVATVLEGRAVRVVG